MMEALDNRVWKMWGRASIYLATSLSFLASTRRAPPPHYCTKSGDGDVVAIESLSEPVG
jgi:hypothetical protein